MGIDYSAVSVMRKRLSGPQEIDRHLAAEMEGQETNRDYPWQNDPPARRAIFRNGYFLE